MKCLQYSIWILSLQTFSLKKLVSIQFTIKDEYVCARSPVWLFYVEPYVNNFEDGSVVLPWHKPHQSTLWFNENIGIVQCKMCYPFINTQYENVTKLAFSTLSILGSTWLIFFRLRLDFPMLCKVKGDPCRHGSVLLNRIRICCCGQLVYVILDHNYICRQMI